MKSILQKLAFGMAITLTMSSMARAGVVIMGTRIVFDGGERDVTVKLSNPGAQPSLVQTWIDSGDPDAKPDTIKVPFTLAPPLARIEPGKGQAIRLVYTGEPLSSTQETVFWFNMLDVPPKAAEADGKSFLQLAFRTRIKLFYRPKGLPGTAEQAIKTLRWAVVPHGKGFGIQGTNDSPYYVSFNGVTVESAGQSFKTVAGGMVAPKSSAVFPLEGLQAAPRAGATVIMNAINDYGAFESVKQVLAP